MRAVARTERAVIRAYLEDIHSKPLLKRENAARTNRLGPRGSAWPLCGLRRTAARAGLKVSETKQEITVEAAMVVANCLKNRPEMPEMKAEGTKTAQRVSAMAMSAVDTSLIVWCAASRGDMPRTMLRSTFSTTTVASSTTIPTARTRPNSE